MRLLTTASATRARHAGHPGEGVDRRAEEAAQAVEDGAAGPHARPGRGRDPARDEGQHGSEGEVPLDLGEGDPGERVVAEDAGQAAVGVADDRDRLDRDARDEARIVDDVTAPGVSVRTANGNAASGTSVATPIVSGIVAQLMGRSAILLSWPEVVRAVMMASAVHHTQMPAGGTNRDHEGVGTVSAKWANVILVEGGGGNGGYKRGSMTATSSVTQGFTAVQGDKIRVALAWDSHTTGSGLFNRTDTLTADLDLKVTAPNGTNFYSITYDNSHEFIEFTAPVTGSNYLISVLKPRFDATSEFYALAWTKWVGTGE